MPIETFHLHQKAALWTRSGYNDQGEQTVSSTPVELSVRWEWGRRLMMDPMGNSIMVDAEVAVDREIAVGSRMWLGKVVDLPGTSFTPEDYQCLVTVYDESPNLRNTQIRRIVGLKRLHDTLP